MTRKGRRPDANAGPAPRYAAALAAMNIQPGDAILEIGCGHGVAVTHLCEALAGRGLVHAIDRSPKMIDTARRRNQPYIDAGMAVFAVTRLQDADLPVGAFDWVLAIRVAEVHEDAAQTLPRIQRWLRPDGRLCHVLDAPSPQRLQRLADEAEKALAAYGFVGINLASRPAGGIVVLTAAARS